MSTPASKLDTVPVERIVAYHPEPGDILVIEVGFISNEAAAELKAKAQEVFGGAVKIAVLSDAKVAGVLHRPPPDEPFGTETDTTGRRT